MPTLRQGSSINIFEKPHEESGNCPRAIKIADVIGQKPINRIDNINKVTNGIKLLIFTFFFLVCGQNEI